MTLALTGRTVDVVMLDLGADLSLSEYDLAPLSAPHFVVGELLGQIHAKGVRYRDLRPGHIILRTDGRPFIVNALGMAFQQALEPETMALDFQVPHAAYDREGFRAILAGYTRAGYEHLDRQRRGFTDALLDELGVPAQRPRPAEPPIDVAAVLQALQSRLTRGDRPTLVRLERQADGSVDFSAEAFLVILGLLALDVDCEDFFARARVRAASELGDRLFQFLRFFRGEPEAAYPFGAAAPQGLDLAVTFALALRNEGALAASPRSMAVLPVAQGLLRAGPPDQAETLGETLVDLALTCAQLSGDDVTGPGSWPSKAWAQQAVVLLQELSQGTRRDELRLSSLTRRLHEQVWYRSPIDRHSWPEDRPDAFLAHSLLVVYRQMAMASMGEGAGTRSVLWSAGLRGLELARATVRRCHALATELGPQEGAMMLRLLEAVLNAQVFTIKAMGERAMREHRQLGGSAWLGFFSDQPGEPSFLSGEFQWATEFLVAASKEGYSLETANDFVQRGAHYLAAAR